MVTWTPSKMEETELSYVVGRERELQQFKDLLEAKPTEQIKRDILHIYGTGGVGKTTLLRLCRRAAAEAGAIFAVVDSRDFDHHGQSLAAALLTQLPAPPPKHADPDGRPAHTVAACLSAIYSLARQYRIILAFDTFEEMTNLEGWLRDRFLPHLPPGTLILLAGRHPLRGEWRVSPAWRERILQWPLAHLERSDCLDYLSKCGVTDQSLQEQLWRKTKGHPLSLSLAAAAAEHGWEDPLSGDSDCFQEMAVLWLKEVPDPALRTVTEAASILRHFDQDRLSYVLDTEVSDEVFERLISLSFVRKSIRGWQLHDLMSESIMKALRDRSPSRFTKIKDRCAIYYAEAILSNSGKRNTGWEVGELFHYAGIKVIRALGSREAQQPHYWETVTESSFGDVLAYIRMRQTGNEEIFGEEIDPDSGEKFVIEYSQEALRQSIPAFDAEALYQLEPDSFKLLKDAKGRIAGLSVIIPIHLETLPWLEKDPFSSPYLLSLSRTEREKLKKPRMQPAGWFIRTLDFVNYLDLNLRSYGLFLLYEHICAGGLFYCSPYPTNIITQAYQGLGFARAEGVIHNHYDPLIPTPTFVLDTRGESLRTFISALLREGGICWPEPDFQTALQATTAPGPPSRLLGHPLMKQLSRREMEVASLVIEGYSNADVANELFISEVTVKKHLRAVYGKLGVKSRTQLASLVHIP